MGGAHEMRKRTQVWKLSAVVYFYIAHMGAVWLFGSDESDDYEPREAFADAMQTRAGDVLYSRPRVSCLRVL